jgi:hypothetical protein
MATVPREWRRTNPWGPAAHEARARGELKSLFYTAEMEGWAEWARQNLQEGDLLFRYGVSSNLRDILNNRVLTRVSDTCFTHDAVVFWQGGDVWVYDAEVEPQGVRKMPFAFWMLDTVPGTLAARRLKAPYRHAIPQALAYCEDAWLRQVPFDSALRLDDERLYCSEMIEKAFRSGGIALSDPTPIRCLPHYRRYRFLRPVVERFTEIRVDEPAFSMGNECYGAFGSPYLEPVTGACPRSDPPTCPPVPFPPS